MKSTILRMICEELVKDLNKRLPKERCTKIWTFVVRNRELGRNRGPQYHRIVGPRTDGCENDYAVWLNGPKLNIASVGTFDLNYVGFLEQAAQRFEQVEYGDE